MRWLSICDFDAILQGILKGEVSLYCWPPFDWFEISCMTTDNFCFYLQNSKTGGQWYSDTSPFSIPWIIVNKHLLDNYTYLVVIIYEQNLQL